MNKISDNLNQHIQIANKGVLSVHIYGGNGFIGTHIAQKLSTNNDINVCCVSRTGHKPLHLHTLEWGENVCWCSGDASDPDQGFLSRCDFVISAVGAAPLPTFSKKGYEEQLFANGIANQKLIAAALDNNVKNLILLGAHYPNWLATDRFAYLRGKRISYEAAEDFANTSDQHKAWVIQPGAVYGKRTLSNGRILPLDWFLQPPSLIFPNLFTCVESIGTRVLSIVTDPSTYKDNFTVITGKEI